MVTIGFIKRSTIQDDLNFAKNNKEKLFKFFNNEQKKTLNQFKENFFYLKITSVEEEKQKDPHLHYIAVRKYSKLDTELKEFFDFLFNSYSNLDSFLLGSIQDMKIKDTNVKHFLDAVQKILNILDEYRLETFPRYDDLEITTFNPDQLYHYNWKIAQILRYIIEEVYTD